MSIGDPTGVGLKTILNVPTAWETWHWIRTQIVRFKAEKDAHYGFKYCLCSILTNPLFNSPINISSFTLRKYVSFLFLKWAKPGLFLFIFVLFT